MAKRKIEEGFVLEGPVTKDPASCARGLGVLKARDNITGGLSDSAQEAGLDPFEIVADKESATENQED